jgi:hypothetical protein
MNKRSLGALIALNLVLLAGLVLTALAPRTAQAQGFAANRASYIMLPGQISGREGQSAVYIVELTTGRMVALIYSSATEQIELLDGRDLARDARGTGGGTPDR